MASVGNETLEMAALGRPFQLGMLYDCRKDRLIPSITLWDQKELASGISEKSQRKTEFSVTSSDSIDDKASTLKVDISLKAGLLGGLVEVSGAAKYFNDTKKSTKQSRVTLQYYTTTRYEQLTMTHLGKGNASHPTVFEDSIATHVVTAVLYGAQAYFVFDRELSSEEKQQEIQGEMKLAINNIPKSSVEGKGAGESKHKKITTDEKLKCTFYGDFQLRSNPTTFQEAREVYASLPSLLGKDGEHAVPVKVWLYPLIKMDSKAVKLVRNISSDLVTWAQTVLEQLNAAEMRTNDLLTDVVTQTFPDVNKKFNELKQSCTQYKLNFMSKLSAVLPSIRGGGQEEKSLIEILENHEGSPFNAEALNMWLDNKEREITAVRSFLRELNTTQVVSSVNKLNEEVFDHRNENIVCFTFTLLDEPETYLLELKNYLKTPQSQNPQSLKCQDSQQWVSTEILQKIRRTLKVFLKLVDINRENKKTKFFIVSKKDQEFPGACILLYENGSFESTYFKTLSKPDVPEVCGITHDAVSLKVVPPRSDQKLKCNLEYKGINQEDWAIQSSTDKTQTFTVTGLQPNIEYEFRYTVEGKLGYTESSDSISNVKTYPASPPGQPSKYLVTPSCITITWEKPAVFGVGVTAHRYKIEYREEGQEQSEESSDWLEKKTEDEACQFTLEDLKVKTRYRIRVSCDCGKDGASSASDEVVIGTSLNKLAAQLIMDNQVATLIKQGAPSIYRLCLKDKTLDKDGVIHRASFGYNNQKVQNKTILMLGETRSGKSTVINGMINYILGVEWGDDFRFKLIHKESSRTPGLSQTSGITVYEIHHQDDFAVPFSLTIVDTPGFTMDLTQNKLIADKIQETFTDPNGMDNINAVCFVVPASLACLTYIHKYILSIFGKDIKDNTQILVTFADGNADPVLDVIKDSGLPFPTRNDGTPVHFKCNNSVLFTCGDSKEDSFDLALWKMGFSNMRSMFNELGKAEAKSLQLTKELIAEREKFEAAVMGLQPVIKACLMTLEEMRKSGQDPEQENWENPTKRDYKTCENLEKQYKEVMGVKMDTVQIILKSLDLIEQLSKSSSRIQEIALWPNLVSTTGYSELVKISQKEEEGGVPGIGLLKRYLLLFERTKNKEWNTSTPVTGENAGSELRMVLLGSTGTGKSASGNTILGSSQFISKASSSTVTKECVKIKGEADGRCVAVVDTPGLCDTELTNEASLREVVKCISMSSPGPHTILIVIQLGQFTEDERRTVELIQKTFGKEAERYTMILFTHGDDLEDEKFEDYYKRADEHLKQFVEKCGGRCHFFNNKNMQDRTQVKGLLEKIEKMVKENGGSCYTNEMYKEVEAALEEEKKKIMKDNMGFSEEDAQEYSPLIKAAKIQVTGENAGSELRMVLLGSTGTGKSASGNTILGSRQFISKASSSRVTKECVKIKGEADGRCVAVVDTPGLCDTELTNEESLRDIGKCISLSSPGPHAFLIVIQLGRFTEEERRTVELLQKAFGKEAERYTVVLFTHGDDLEHEKFENYYKRADKKLKQLVKKCGNRYHVFNNRNMDDRTQVTELLKKIEKMVKENGGGCYTSEMYKKAEAGIEEEKVKRMKDNPGCSEEQARIEAERSNLITAHSSASGALRGVLTGAAAARAAVGAVVGAAVGAAAGAAVGGPIGAAAVAVTGENAGSELRMVLLGSTGTGKSASGNTILGSRQFISKASSSRVTKECVKIKGEADGRCVAVVDTPGLCDTELTNEESLRDIGKCISLSSPGPHAFLIVIQLCQFTKEERITVELLQKAFGKEAERYTVVLFTHGDDLEHEKFENYYKRADKKLKQLVKKCGNRYHVFNNRNMDDRTQVTELLKKIEKMVKENGGSCYTNEMYKEVEAALEEEKKKIMEDNPGFSVGDARNEAERSSSITAHYSIAEVLTGAAAGPLAGVATGAAVGVMGGPIGAVGGAVVGAVVGIFATQNK